MVGYPAIMVKNSEKETKRKRRSERNEGDVDTVKLVMSRVSTGDAKHIHTQAKSI